MHPASAGALFSCVGVLPPIVVPLVCAGELCTWACDAGEYDVCCCELFGCSAGEGVVAATACNGANTIFFASLNCMTGAQSGAGAGVFRDFTIV